MIDFARVLMIDADRLWQEASLDHKHKMIGVLFPKGLTFGEGRGFGSPETCFAFKWLPEDWQDVEATASPTGVEDVWAAPLATRVKAA